MREECYSRVLAEIVNQHHQIQLASHWGDGTTASSDGQHFPLGSVGQGLGHRNPKYGSGPVVIFYTHISDQYSLRFAPRIRDVGERRLYPIGERKRWPKLEPTFGESIRLREIETQWDEIMRAANSIRLGTVTASLLVRKLAAYPRQNRLALAMREFGRIERTLFLLNWMQDLTLRSRVQAGLNKGEAKNALARAVFFK